MGWYIAQTSRRTNSACVLCRRLASAQMGLLACYQNIIASYVVGKLQNEPVPLHRQAFILYEEAVPDSKGEVTALQSIVGTLHRCRVFGPDNRCAA